MNDGIADIKDPNLFLQAMEGMDRAELQETKRALERKLTDLNVNIESLEQHSTDPVPLPMLNARRHTKLKIVHVDRVLKQFNDRDREKAAVSRWLVYRGGWYLSHGGPAEWLVYDLKEDPEAEMCEAVRITAEQWSEMEGTRKIIEPV
jgi:hypothetical protein